MTATINIMLAMLTPLQRWNAARQSDGSIMTQRWFIAAGVVAIVILTVLLVVVNYYRRTQKQRISAGRFIEYADRIGLTGRECQILRDIAARAGLRHNESVFSMVEAFDSGASAIVEDALALRGVEASKRVSVVVSTLREKLGFEKRYQTSAGSARPSSKPSSRQIPVGRQLRLTCSGSDGPADDASNPRRDMKAMVVTNDDVQLTVKLASSLASISRGPCCVRYCFGGSVWEFDSAVVNQQGHLLSLHHSDNVRFINRRRFLRVPVHKPALIAHFPFARTLQLDTGTDEDGRPLPADANSWGTLNFVRAVVTELAGPGLRVRAPLEVKRGERVLVVVRLDTQDSVRQSASEEARLNGSEPGTQAMNHEGRVTIKIVEDIGEIRHTSAVQGGFSFGLELTGLSDSNVNELIQATNAAAVKAGGNTAGTTAFSDEVYEHMDSEPVLAGWSKPSSGGEI
jgi:hypothetical protein